MEEDAVRQQWMSEQIDLKQRLSLIDKSKWNKEDIKYIAGVDISFFKDNHVDAISSLVVMTYPNCNVVYEDYELVKLELPYISGFLGFREVPHLVKLIDSLKKKSPQYTPDVILVDGNGILHPRGFGLASHLGVLTEMVTIGVAKKLLFIDGVTREKVKDWTDEHLHQGGDSFKIVGDSGNIHGAILRSTTDSTKPIYVSIGHNVSLETSLDIVKAVCINRIPEPIRQADLRSRDVVRKALNNSSIS
ncbi:endonuclease V [Acrasis kona]|uniref:Endonuclease V n=1 Tax=Acrasis kona TaxID=1008807 RepID=A0AAW2ZJ53_9EUKA